jgi:hypothetical protein
LAIPFLRARGGEARGVIVAPERLRLPSIPISNPHPTAAIAFHGGLSSSRIEARQKRER